MAAIPVQPEASFNRRLKLGDPSLIESRCNLCGFLIVGSVLRGLPQQEAEHLRRCLAALPKKKAASAAS